jgi:hypothetical protein
MFMTAGDSGISSMSSHTLSMAVLWQLSLAVSLIPYLFTVMDAGLQYAGTSPQLFHYFSPKVQ